MTPIFVKIYEDTIRCQVTFKKARDDQTGSVYFKEEYAALVI